MTLDLRTGNPLWLHEKHIEPQTDALVNDITTEIAVIGCGISGALAAHALCMNGYDVVMVDERGPGKGSTMASTAILSYETDVMLAEMIEDLGERQAVRVYMAGIEALEYIKESVKHLGDDCGLKTRDSLYMASSMQDARELENEYRLRKKHGFNLRFLDAGDVSEFFSFDAPAALLTPDMAEVNPLRLTLALMKACQNRGMRVYSHTKIEKYEGSLAGCTLHTSSGNIIKARYTIFATGYQSQVMLRQKDVKLISSYAIASEPVENFSGWHGRCSIWESARPYLYMRTTADNRVVAGGEDIPFENETLRDALLVSKAETLCQKAQAKFPDMQIRISYAWAGTFAESHDGLPYIGAHPDYPGAYFALGYGGNGITFAAMASRIIPDLIAGKYNGDADIFRFGR